MWNLSLTACSFHLRKANSKGIENIYSLNREFEIRDKNNVLIKEYSDIIDVMKSFAEKYSSYIDDEEDKRMFSCDFLTEDYGETESYRYLLGIVHSGTYGVPSIITDSQTKKIVYRKSNKQADIKDFYIMIIIPKDNKIVTVEKGLLFFQNIGQYGIKTVTTKYIREYLKNYFDMSFYCGNISPDIFVNKLFENNQINQLLLTKNYTSYDVADKIYRGYGQEIRMLSKLRLDTKLSDKIRNFAKGKCNFFEFENIEYDKLRIKVDIGGRERTINLHNIENLSVIEGLPNDIQFIDGSLNKEKLLYNFNRIANEYMETMVFQITK